jgi:Flp pilus assembly protein TadD
VAERQHLYGKAIRMTNKALLLEPNDPDAIAVQGEAMVEMGAVARAQANLQKLQTICGAKGCPQVAQLSAAITRGPTVASAKAPETPKSN